MSRRRWHRNKTHEKVVETVVIPSIGRGSATDYDIPMDRVPSFDIVEAKTEQPETILQTQMTTHSDMSIRYRLSKSKQSTFQFQDLRQ